jgi:hypothetical protein
MGVVPLLECLDQLIRGDAFRREAQAIGVRNLAYGSQHEPGQYPFENGCADVHA